MLFLITPKKIKYLSIDLIKHVQGLYAENYKILIEKKIKEHLNKCQHTLCSWTERLIIIKMSVLLKLIDRFNAIPIKFSARLFLA